MIDGKFTSLDGDTSRERVKRVRLPAAERRAQILAVARDLFVAEGYDRASMRRIAEAAGITPTAIYDHFADKETLLSAIAEQFFEGLIAATTIRETDPTDQLAGLRGLMANYVRYGLQHPNEYRLVFMTPLAGFMARPGHRGIAKTTPTNGPLLPDRPVGGPPKGAQSFGLLQTEIERLVSLGALRPDDPWGFADSVWAMGHGLVSLMITKGQSNFTAVEQWITTSIGILIDGMRQRPSP